MDSYMIYIWIFNKYINCFYKFKYYSIKNVILLKNEFSPETKQYLNRLQSVVNAKGQS